MSNDCGKLCDDCRCVEKTPINRLMGPHVEYTVNGLIKPEFYNAEYELYMFSVDNIIYVSKTAEYKAVILNKSYLVDRLLELQWNNCPLYEVTVSAKILYPEDKE